MQYLFDGYNDVIRLSKGERLSDTMHEFAEQSGLDGAWLSGLGGARDITLGYYDLATKQYQWKTFNGLYEIAGMQGNLARAQDGTMMFHVHGTFADANYQTIGGHIKDFMAGATVEIFVHRTYKPLSRKNDPDVGLPVLNLDDHA